MVVEIRQVYTHILSLHSFCPRCWINTNHDGIVHRNCNFLQLRWILQCKSHSLRCKTMCFESSVTRRNSSLASPNRWYYRSNKSPSFSLSIPAISGTFRRGDRIGRYQMPGECAYWPFNSTFPTQFIAARALFAFPGRVWAPSRDSQSPTAISENQRQMQE